MNTKEGRKKDKEKREQKKIEEVLLGKRKRHNQIKLKSKKKLKTETEGDKESRQFGKFFVEASKSEKK